MPSGESPPATAKSSKLRFATVVTGFLAGLAATLCGCELVAGIRDIHLAATVADSGAGSGVPGATIPSSDDAASPTDEAASSSGDDAPVGAFDGGDPDTSAGESGTGSASSSDGTLAIELIDDMEGQTEWILVANGRNGPWFTYNDGTDGGFENPPSTAMPPHIDALLVPPRGSSHYGARVSASGFQSYVGMGFDLNDQAGAPATYDATAYQGIAFWARVTSGSLTVRFSLSDINTASAGGVCTTCGDYFGKNLTLTPTWTQFYVFYRELAQVGWGAPPVAASPASPPGTPGALAASRVYGCQFQVSSNAADFELWIDDVSFIKK